MIPKTDDFKEFGYNTAYFHSIFDSYLQPNLGNVPIKSLEFFKNVIENLMKKEENEISNLKCEIHELLKRSINVEKNKNYRISKFYKFYLNDNYKGEYNIKEIIERFQDGKDMSPKVEINEEKYSNLEDIIFTLSKQDKIKDTVNEYFNTYEELIIPSGWRGDNGGHLISSYYKKIEEDLYEIIIFNSGLGIGKYHQNFDDGEFNITISCKTNREKAIEIISFCDYFKSINYNEEEIKSVDVYYNVLLKKFKFNINKDKYTNNDLKNMCKQLPQLSGSCTFFGFYYNILYLFNREKINFNDFEEQLIKDSILQFLEHLEKKEYITDFEKSYIDLIDIIPNKNNEMNSRIKDLYNKYKNNIKNDIISFNFEDFREEKNSFSTIENITYKNDDLNDVITYLLDIEKLNKYIDSSVYINKIYVMLKLRSILDKDNDFFKINNLDFMYKFHYLYLSVFHNKNFKDKPISDYYIIFQLICAKIIENNDFLYFKSIVNTDKIIYDLHLRGEINIKPLNNDHFDLYEKYYNLINFNPVKRVIDTSRIIFDKDKFFELYNKDKFESLEDDKKKGIIKLILIISGVKLNLNDVSFISSNIILINNNGHGITQIYNNLSLDYFKNNKSYFNYPTVDLGIRKNLLYKKYYINPYKIVEFINKKNVNSINDYYKKFYESENLLNYNLEKFDPNENFIFDEFNLFRFDIFDTEYNAKNIEFEDTTFDNFTPNYNLNFTYSNIYKKNKELLQNLNQNNLIDIISTLDSFSILCIVILLYNHGVDLDNKLVENINIIKENRNKDNDFKDSLLILSSLINKENNLSNIVDILKSNPNLTKIENINQHINYILFSLIIRNYLEEDKDINVFNTLFLNKIKNSNLFKSENINNIIKNEYDITVEYKNGQENEIYLNVDYIDSKKYLENFIFKKKNDIYIGKSDIFNYKLTLKTKEEELNNEFEITRIIDNDNFELIDFISNSGNSFITFFEKMKDEYLFLINKEKNKLLIENNDIKHFKIDERGIKRC